MRVFIFIIIIILILVLIGLPGNNIPKRTIECMTPVTQCSSCPELNTTCRDAGGQTFFNDPSCFDTPNDSQGLGGLGCMGTTGCRYCCFGPFSQVQCPGGCSNPGSPPSNPPPSNPPSQPLPPPPPKGPFKVTLKNECPVTVLAAALGPSKVRPVDASGKETSWVLEPQKELYIDIPPEWTDTAGKPVIGPRFWARTGCNYTIDENDTSGRGRASCEGGDCGNKYDCSDAGLGGIVPGSWAEFCFQCGNGLTYYDVSLVDGSHMSMDIEPINPSQYTHPYDHFWCKKNLCNQQQDIRDTCPPDFRLMSSELPHHNPETPDTVTACFSNCAKWAYLRGRLGGGYTCAEADDGKIDAKTREVCQNWRKYCCQSISSNQNCGDDSDCHDGEACWNGRCQCRAYYKNPPCPDDVCTHPYCEITPKLKESFTNSQCPQGASTQPKATNCNRDASCIGDDTLHQVCPQAYTWPNDPQTYDCDATNYKITFCPGGLAANSKPLADSHKGFPDCSMFDTNVYKDTYNYQQALQNCSGNLELGNNFACARKAPNSWACGVTDGSCYGLGVPCIFGRDAKVKN
jgi:hypothetical protein